MWSSGSGFESRVFPISSRNIKKDEFWWRERKKYRGEIFCWKLIFTFDEFTFVDLEPNRSKIREKKFQKKKSEKSKKLEKSAVSNGDSFPSILFGCLDVIENGQSGSTAIKHMPREPKRGFESCQVLGLFSSSFLSHFVVINQKRVLNQVPQEGAALLTLRCKKYFQICCLWQNKFNWHRLKL